MKVSELIEALQELPADDLVVMSIDPEGNGFRMLWQIQDNSTFNDNETGIKELTEEDIQDGYCEDDVMEGQSCIVLWPE